MHFLPDFAAPARWPALTPSPSCLRWPTLSAEVVGKVFVSGLSADGKVAVGQTTDKLKPIAGNPAAA